MSAQPDNEAISATAARWVVRRDAGLSGSEPAQLASWLSANPRHKAAFDHYARAWSTFEGPQRAAAQHAMMHGIAARVKHRRRRRIHNALTATAACAIATLALVTWRHTHDDDAPPPAGVVLVRPERLALADGSLVDIKPGTVIDVRYDSSTRLVILSGGGAHFQVRKGEPRPFVVMAGGMEARAVGTAFVVQLDVEQVEVLVTEGQVAIDKAAASQTAPDSPAADAAPDGGDGPPLPPPVATESPRAPVTENANAPPPPATGGGIPGIVAPPLAMLGAGERIVVKTAPATPATTDAPDATDAPAAGNVPVPAVMALTPAEVNARLEWLVPRIEFSTTPLVEAVALINRHARMPGGGGAAVRLVLAPELSHLALEPVSGIFRADNIAAFVQLLALNMDIEGEPHGDEIILRKAKPRPVSK